MKTKATQSTDTPSVRVAKVKAFMEQRGIRNYTSVFMAFGYNVPNPQRLQVLMNGRKPTAKDLPSIRAMEAVVASMQALPVLDIKAA